MGRGAAGACDTSHRIVRSPGKAHCSNLKDDLVFERYLSISAELFFWAAARSAKDGTKDEGDWPAEDKDATVGGGRLRVSATTLADPATWRISVQNSEM